ncbi:MAG: hypothetical protein ACREHG_00520 [Candidatus Saccharimonadales bacterium]
MSNGDKIRFGSPYFGGRNFEIIYHDGSKVTVISETNTTITMPRYLFESLDPELIRAPNLKGRPAIDRPRQATKRGSPRT